MVKHFRNFAQPQKKQYDFLEHFICFVQIIYDLRGENEMLLG